MEVLLLDVDGVVLKKGEYFSERFAREYDLKPESVIEFFKGPFISCQSGQADLKEQLVPYLDTWGWTKGVEAFLEYWFVSDIVLNPGIVTQLEQLKNRGVKCYLASNNELYRAEKIMNFLQDTVPLDGAYFSARLKVRKDNPAFFRFILDDLQKSPEMVHFIDNDQKNVDSARTVGISAHLYTPSMLETLVALK